MAETQTPQELKKLHELKKLLTEVSEEILQKVDQISNILCRLDSIDSVVQHEDMAKTIIECKSILERFPVGESPYEAAAEPPIPDPNNQAHLRLVSFRKAMRYSVWEITSKVSVLRDFISETQSLRKALTVAMTIRKLMKSLESIEELDNVEPSPRPQAANQPPLKPVQSPSFPSTPPTSNSLSDIKRSQSPSLQKSPSMGTDLRQNSQTKLNSTGLKQTLKPTNPLVSPNVLQKPPQTTFQMKSASSLKNSSNNNASAPNTNNNSNIPLGTQPVVTADILKQTQLKQAPVKSRSHTNTPSQIKAQSNSGVRSSATLRPSNPSTTLPEKNLSLRRPPVVPKKPDVLKGKTFEEESIIPSFEKAFHISEPPPHSNSELNNLDETERLIQDAELRLKQLEAKEQEERERKEKDIQEREKEDEKKQREERERREREEREKREREERDRRENEERERRERDDRERREREDREKREREEQERREREERERRERETDKEHHNESQEGQSNLHSPPLLNAQHETDDLSTLSISSQFKVENKGETIDPIELIKLRQLVEHQNSLIQQKDKEVEYLKKKIETMENTQPAIALRDIKRSSQRYTQSSETASVDRGTQTKISFVSPEETEKCQELLKAIDIATKEINNRLDEIKEDLIFDTSKVGRFDMKEMLLLTSLLKDARQILINYEDASYQYPTAQELKRTTQKINHLHQLGQGKLVTLYELGRNTLEEIQLNLNNFRDPLGVEDGYSTLSRFAAVLWHTKQTLDRLKPDKLSSYSLKNQLNNIKLCIREEKKSEVSSQAEKLQINEMAKKILYLSIKTFLWKQTIDNYKKRTASVSNNRPIKPERTDDLTSFIGNFNDQNRLHQLPVGQDLLEKILTVLRNEPRYLVELVKHQSFSSLDSWVELITTRFFADMFLVQEEYLLLKFIEAVIQSQFVSTVHPSEIIRENSFLTKLLSAYTKRQSGRTHLIACLKEPILHVISTNDSCELDPVRLYQGHYKVDKVEKSVAENDLQVKRLISENTRRLKKFCHHFLDSILAALPTVPYGIRFIIRQILTRVETSFGSVKERDKSILVGGFMFLRYFSPAILSPETNGIIETLITDTQRRNLTLITKVLQNLANDLFFQGKEAYMVPMTEFLKVTKPALDSYFLNLGKVPGPETQLGISQAVCNGKEILISESDLYLLINALKVCRDKLIKEDDDPLRPLLQELSTLPAPNNTSKVPIVLHVDQGLQDDPEKPQPIHHAFFNFFSQTVVPVPDHPSLVESLEVMVKQSSAADNQEVTAAGETLLKLVNEYPDRESILISTYQYCLRKKQETERILMEKIEMLQSLEQHRKVVNFLVDSKANYDQYLTSSSGKAISYFQWRSGIQ